MEMGIIFRYNFGGSGRTKLTLQLDGEYNGWEYSFCRRYETEIRDKSDWAGSDWRRWRL